MSKTIDARYQVIKDNQGGSWGESHGAQTAEYWLDVMFDWLDADDAFEDEQDRQEQQNYWLGVIDEGREQELIDYIAEVWDLEFIKVQENSWQTK